MKIPTELLDRVLIDWGLQVKLATHRDRLYCRSRVEHEGMEFLTISLPSICDALDKSLAAGRITPSCFVGFKPYKRGGSLPAFMSGFFMRIFDVDGVILSRPDIDCIRAIRQVSRLFKKVELPCSDARLQSAYERYIENDESILRNNHRGPIDASLWTAITGHLWSDLEKLSGELYCFPGQFGSGACAERRAFNNRHDILQWPTRSERSFPVDYHATHDFFVGDEECSGIEFLSYQEELPVRVVSVPKTLKTPRIISVEPSYMMLMQQSIAKPLMAYLESKRFPYNSIRFTDQTVNREMAREGSIDGKLSTIDLKDASDLVHNGLVHSVFKACPTFLDFIQDSRSTSAQLPSGKLVRLNKFASMGSALCFPIEAMVFFSIVCYSILRQTKVRPSRSVLRKITANISVYGDDIIAPTDVVPGIMEDLETFGLKVNQDKSFFTGFFRESCGGDYYKGHDVTPTYVRRWDFSGNTRDASLLASHVSLTNQFYMKGNWHVAKYIRENIDRDYRKFRIPSSVEPVGVLHYASVLFTGPARWDPKYSLYCIKGPKIEVSTQSDSARLTRGNMLRVFGPGYQARALNSMRAGSRRESVEDGSLSTCGYKLDLSKDQLPHTTDESDLERSRCTYGELERNGYSYPNLFSNHRSQPTIVFGSDGLTSNVPYSTKLKNRWTPTNVGLSW